MQSGLEEHNLFRSLLFLLSLSPSLLHSLSLSLSLSPYYSLSYYFSISYSLSLTHSAGYLYLSHSFLCFAEQTSPLSPSSLRCVLPFAKIKKIVPTTSLMGLFVTGRNGSFRVTTYAGREFLFTPLSSTARVFEAVCHFWIFDTKNTFITFSFHFFPFSFSLT